jgi:formylglycine-generating enzyme required for sulfatase activity
MDLGRRSIVEWAEAAPEESAATFVPSQDKFVVETSIGRGGARCNLATALRRSCRNWSPPSSRGADFGFRCARSL